MMHQSGTSMGALDVMLPRCWSKPLCSPKIWWSCEALGGVKLAGVKSSFTLKGFWAWYVYILPGCFSFSFFFYLTQHSFLLFCFKAVQSTFRLEEISNSLFQQLEEERKMRAAAAVQTLAIAENSNTNLKKKLTAEEQARKSADAALKGAERQAES